MSKLPASLIHRWSRLFSIAFIRYNSTLHSHYTTFAIHPGITTLITCIIIAVLLLLYMWSEGLWKTYEFLRKTCCCCCSPSIPPRKRESKEEIEMIYQARECSSANKSLSCSDEYSDLDSVVECRSLKNVGHFKEKEQHYKEISSPKNILQQSTAPILLSSLSNIKTFPESPMILLTPATPLPSHTSSENLEMQSSESNDL